MTVNSSTWGSGGLLSGGSSPGTGRRLSDDSFLYTKPKKKKSKKKKVNYKDPYDIVSAKTSASYHAVYDTDLKHLKKVAK